jgi:mRNA interferase MazF
MKIFILPTMERILRFKNKIILVPFPFDDFSSTKVRPSLCLTNPIGDHKHIIIAFISSVIPPDLESTDILLSTADKDFSRTGLKITSVIRLHKMVTIPSYLIKKELGEIDDQIQRMVSANIKRLFED